MLPEVADHDTGVLVSEKEAADLEELLQFFEMGHGDAQQFAVALQEEAGALEAANVHAVLESDVLLDPVLRQLRSTQGLLDDLDESLKVFGFKLRHMRDDIAAIESSNNSLEATARHNAALLALLESLLSGLQLPPDWLAQLEQPAFDARRLPGVMAAAKGLHAARQRLTSPDSPGAISPLLFQMSAVAEARAQLEQVAVRFVNKACSFLLSLVQQLVAEAMSGRGSNRRVRVGPTSRQQLHAMLQEHQPLVQLVAVLQPGALLQLQQQVCLRVHELLQWELHTASQQLQTAAAADLAACGDDYALSRDRHTAAAGSGGGGRTSGRVSFGSAAGSDSQYDEPPEAFELPPAAASAGINAAKRTAFLEGGAPGLPLHEAWRLLLDGFLPSLADEASLLADLLLMYRGDDQRPLQLVQYSHQQQGLPGAEVSAARPADAPLTSDGARALEQLLAGLEREFIALPELAVQSHQVQLLPLLAVARAWRARLQPLPHAAPLVVLLNGVVAQLTAAWAGFVRKEVALVQQYEGKSKMGLHQGIKHLHVLSVVRRFCQLAHDQESALAEGLEAAAATAAGAAGSSGGAAVTGARDAVLGEAQQVRADADALYGSLCPVLLARIEALAASDLKYQARCRLENYTYLDTALKGLAPRLAALQPHWQVCESRRAAALSGYVREQLQYSKLWKLLEFGDKLDKLLQTVTPPEVSFQRDCSPGEVRGLVRSAMDGADKKLEALAGRARKHLGDGGLFEAVWAALKEQLLARYEHLEALMEQCYPTTPLRPSPEELRELFRATSGG